jgi:hypothetical protein
MGKWDVDYDDYEERSGGYDGEKPKPGVYEGFLQHFEKHDSSETSLHWVFEIDEEDSDYTGWRGHLYSDMENAKWKTQQIAKAIQGGEEKKISVDPEKAEKIIKAAKRVKIVVRKGEYDGEYQPRIGRVLALEETTSKGKGGKAAKGGKAKKGSKDPWAEGDD